MEKKLPTVYVCSITVIDPDTKLPVEVEIRKDPESGAMIGIDGSHLENTEQSVYSPYNRGRTLLIPDDEAPGRVEFDLTKPKGYTVAPEPGPVVVFEWVGEGKTPYQMADFAYNNILESAGEAPVCTVLMPDGTTHTVDLSKSDFDLTDMNRPVSEDQEKSTIDWSEIYDDGRCPDCQTAIPSDAQEGDACENCGHVFVKATPNDDTEGGEA